MSNDISADEIEIIHEFVQESRDMIDNLEPTIIELGQSCRGGDCWVIKNCGKTACSRHSKNLSLPCWMHKGFLCKGDQTCDFTKSEQDCLTCDVFRSTNGDGQTMNAIFRLFHSMKGSAGFLEFSKLQHVAHAAENLLDLIRSGKIKMQPAHVSLLCESCDFAKAALDYVEESFEDEGMADQAVAISDRLRKAIDAAQVLASQPPETTAVGTPVAPSETTAPEVPAEDMQDLEFKITTEMIEGFVLESDELLQEAEQSLLKWSSSPDDKENIASLFRNIHSFKGNCGFFSYQDLESLSHCIETIIDGAKEGKNFSRHPAPEILKHLDTLRRGVADISNGGSGQVENLASHLDTLHQFLEEESAVVSQVKAGEGEDEEATEESPLLGELLVRKGVVDAVSIDAALARQRQPVGEILVEMGKAKAEDVEKVVQEQKKIEKRIQASAVSAQGKNASIKRQDIRVELGKLDSLINLIGELVIAENMIIHNPDLENENLELDNFNKAAQQMGKIIRDLQEMAMIIRMIPVSGLFRKMIRLVHDISMKSGKKVDLQLQGEETEIDKTVIETISDPLVHLLRNSMDHGLEPPAERLAAGKSEKGILKLSACHEEGEIWITVEDDGRGLDRDRLLAKAISKGLVTGDGSDMSETEVFNLIFAPGFSMAEKITDISGRGVGMDVVKQNLEKIKGKIEVTSKKGFGTKVNLRIPLTLAIIEGMLIRVDHAKCILPLLSIRDIFRPLIDAITITPEGQELVKVRGKFYPVIRLHKALHKNMERKALNEGVLVLVEHQGIGISLFVDEILGQQQTVIKGLSDYFENTHFVSGCTILGDGQVCMILDVGGLVEMRGDL